MEVAQEAEVAIKTMQLYSHIDRIWNELGELEYDRISDRNVFVPVETLNKFDCYNYSGPEGARQAAQVLNLNPSCKILDIGAGLGGPARCISSLTKAKVIGVELQEDLAQLANELCGRCAIENDVRVISGDFLDPDLKLNEFAPFDAAVSWLVILHIPLESREKLFTRVFDLLKPGGKMYIEDFFLVDGSLSTDEENLLKNEVYVPNARLPTREEYMATVQRAGFLASFEDVTAEWTAFTTSRLVSWRENKGRHVHVHNEETWESLDRFYSAIVNLFQGGHLGGVKLIIEKPIL